MAPPGVDGARRVSGSRGAPDAGACRSGAALGRAAWRGGRAPARRAGSPAGAASPASTELSRRPRPRQVRPPPRAVSVTVSTNRGATTCSAHDLRAIGDDLPEDGLVGVVSRRWGRASRTPTASARFETRSCQKVLVKPAGPPTSGPGVQGRRRRRALPAGSRRKQCSVRRTAAGSGVGVIGAWATVSRNTPRRRTLARAETALRNTWRHLAGQRARRSATQCPTNLAPPTSARITRGGPAAR